jgi:hypothetical protein
MIRIAISQAAFDAIARTLPFGSMSFENATNERGERLVWLAPTVIDRLRAMRSAGESFSAVILRIAQDSNSGCADGPTAGRKPPFWGRSAGIWPDAPSRSSFRVTACVYKADFQQIWENDSNGSDS